MKRKVPLISGESYHVYNRGAHQQAMFLDTADHERFQALLYLANSSTPIVLREILERKKHRGQFSGVYSSLGFMTKGEAAR